MSAISFPLSTSDFLDLLPVASLSMDNPEQVEVSMTGGGEPLSAEIGPRLWRGQIRLGRMTRFEASEAGALIDLVRGPGRSFMVTDLVRPGPAYDPTGDFISGYSPVVAALDADNKRLKLQGLPRQYTLQRGDRLAFSYGSSPVRYALHRVVSALVSADAAGATDWIEVSPHIRPGAAVSAAVSLFRPSCKAILVPKTSSMGTSRHTLTDGASSISFRP